MHEFFGKILENSYISKMNSNNEFPDLIKSNITQNEILIDFKNPKNNRYSGPLFAMSEKNVQNSSMHNSELEIQTERSLRKELTEKESAISTISKNMRILHQLPQNKFKKKKTSPVDISGPFEKGATIDELRKSAISNTDNISREISQINNQLTPKGHTKLVQYKLNPNDTANFNIELEDESYLKDLVDDIHESKLQVVFDSDKKPPTKGLVQ